MKQFLFSVQVLQFLIPWTKMPKLHGLFFVTHANSSHSIIVFLLTQHERQHMFGES